jgi:hypothetical protein
MEEIIYSPDTPVQTVLAAIQSLVKWGGLEPKAEKSAEAGTQAVQININIPNYS